MRLSRRMEILLFEKEKDGKKKGSILGRRVTHSCLQILPILKRKWIGSFWKIWLTHRNSYLFSTQIPKQKRKTQNCSKKVNFQNGASKNKPTIITKVDAT